ncbi:hypothetical protein SPB21_18885 [Leptothoe sp. ISB3NOV94-8A]
MEKKKWQVVFKNNSVRKAWKELEQRFPSAAKRCKKHLELTPLARITGSVFPLKGKKYKGKWEYEVSEGDRVYYFPKEGELKVMVFYAGTHPKKTPEF